MGRSEDKYDRLIIDVADLLPVPNGVVIVTQVDLHLMTMTGKIVPTYREAKIWLHDSSLKQFPEWHAEECSFCKEKLDVET